jgi:DNA-binding XRE family transcriptional regulator
LTKTYVIHKIKFMNVELPQRTSDVDTSLRNAAKATEESWLDAIEALVQLRKKKNLTQKDVGLALGVSQESISQFENGEANPSIRRIKLYAMAIGVSVDFKIVDTGFTPDYHLIPEATVITKRTKPGPRSTKAKVTV